MRVVVLAPVDNSLYSLLVAELCRREPGVEVAGIVVRAILNLSRMKSEFKRDGVRLLRKVWRKLILGDPSGAGAQQETEPTLKTLAAGVGLPARSLKRLADAYRIPFKKVTDLNAAASVSFLKDRQPDLILFTGGGLIRQPVLDQAGLGIFNAHMGILPLYRGMDVVEWPVLEDRHQEVGLGLTLHFMDNGVDTGPVIAQRRMPIKPGDTFESLRRRCEIGMVELMLAGVRMARDGRLQPMPQRPEDGRQYFLMHPRLYEVAKARLAQIAR